MALWLWRLRKTAWGARQSSMVTQLFYNGACLQAVNTDHATNPSGPPFTSKLRLASKGILSLLTQFVLLWGGCLLFSIIFSLYTLLYHCPKVLLSFCRYQLLIKAEQKFLQADLNGLTLSLSLLARPLSPGWTSFYTKSPNQRGVRLLCKFVSKIRISELLYPIQWLKPKEMCRRIDSSELFRIGHWELGPVTQLHRASVRWRTTWSRDGITNSASSGTLRVWTWMTMRSSRDCWLPPSGSILQPNGTLQPWVILAPASAPPHWPGKTPAFLTLTKVQVMPLVFQAYPSS